ncbi:major facilitator superfamily protein [Arthrobacter sp. Hiyo8]|nr:major facilitator superfamily protein [Arthrobacter sp. Hiyo8]
MVVLVAIFIMGTFGLNFVLFIAAMVGTEFGMDAGAFGLLNSVMAIGSVTGALLSARRGRPRMRLIFAAAGGFGLASGLAALAPNYTMFALALIPCGLFALTMITSANGYVQSTTEPVMRGRVMALYMAIFMGGTPIGAPFVGWVSNVAGPRWAVAWPRPRAPAPPSSASCGSSARASCGSASTAAPAGCGSSGLSPKARVQLIGTPLKGTAPPGIPTRTTPTSPDRGNAAGPYFFSSPTTKSMLASNAETSSGSMATKVAMRSWLRPSLR